MVYMYMLVQVSGKTIHRGECYSHIFQMSSSIMTTAGLEISAVQLS